MTYTVEECKEVMKQIALDVQRKSHFISLCILCYCLRSIAHLCE